MGLSKSFFFKLFLLCLPFLIVMSIKFILYGEDFSIYQIYKSFTSINFNTDDVVSAWQLMYNTFKTNILGVNSFFANVDGVIDWLRAFGNFISAIWEFMSTIWNLAWQTLKSLCENIFELIRFFGEVLF